MSRSYEASLTKSYPATIASNNRYYDPHQRDQLLLIQLMRMLHLSFMLKQDTLNERDVHWVI